VKINTAALAAAPNDDDAGLNTKAVFASALNATEYPKLETFLSTSLMGRSTVLFRG